jgi:hypothetical protein
MKLTFKIDLGYDAEMIFQMLQGDDWQDRALNMQIATSIATKIHQNKNPQEVKDDIKTLVDDTYRIYLPYIEKTKNLYSKSWQEVITEFSQLVEEVTVPWFYKEYICIVTHFNQGISNWNGNVVGRWWKENPYLQRRITAHEILLAHYFSIHRNLYPDSGLSDNQIWALAEIAAFALTGLEKRISRLLPYQVEGYYFGHNYPQIVELQKKLQEPFLKRKNFQEYIEKGIVEVKKYKNF